MTAKSDELVEELVSACVAFGREKEPDWQTRIEKARCALKAHIEELEAARIEWVFEDQLPDGIPDAVYSAMYACSEVDFVRVFPSVTVDGRNRFLIEPPEVQE
jgi:ABC-type enterochelin transport system ATPase subunit